MKTTGKNNKQTSIATVGYLYLTNATFPTPLNFNYRLPLNVPKDFALGVLVRKIATEHYGHRTVRYVLNSVLFHLTSCIVYG
jgi:hypothetical protein